MPPSVSATGAIYFDHGLPLSNVLGAGARCALHAQAFTLRIRRRYVACGFVSDDTSFERKIPAKKQIDKILCVYAPFLECSDACATRCCRYDHVRKSDSKILSACGKSTGGSLSELSP